MISFSWGLPSSKKQADYLNRTRQGEFNLDENYVGSTLREPFSENFQKDLEKDGFFINNARIKLGTGEAMFLRARKSLISWSQFQLGWTSVDANTPVEIKQRFLVRVNEMIVAWLLQPLEIKYVLDTHCTKMQTCPPNASSSINSEKLKGVFAFGSVTLKGHLLSGEDMFSIKWEEDDSVWYETLSFSKPATFLSLATYPYVQWKQKLFAKQSSVALLKAVSDS